MRAGFGVLALLVIGTACEDVSGPGSDSPPRGILDARTGGDPGFYWLPPVGPAGVYDGVIDPDARPALVVCRLHGDGCIAEEARYTLDGGPSSGLVFNEVAGAYEALWSTAGLDPGPHYRLRVLLGSAILGTADVDILPAGTDPAGGADFVQVAAGQSVNVGFRIERLRPVTEWEVVRAGLSGSSLQAVWAASREDVFAVGSDGTSLHFDGSRWTVLEPGRPGRLLQGIGGRSPTDVWAVGGSGLVRHFDGAAWTTVRVGGPSLSDVWVSASGEVTAVGDAGTILHYDGTTWTEQDSGESASLRAITHGPGDELYVVGKEGTVLRHDGTGWASVVDGGWWDFEDIWVAANGDLFIVGSDPTTGALVLLHRDQGEWRLLPPPPGFAFGINAVWGTAPDEVYAAGSRFGVLRFDGTRWGVLGYLETTSAFHDLHGTSDGQIFAVGDHAGILQRRGDEWTFDPLGPPLHDVWLDPEGGAVAVGMAGVLFESDGGSWTRRLFGRDLAAVWGRGANDVYVVGSAEVIFRRVDGEWTAMGLPTAYGSRVLDIGGGRSVVLGVGGGGAMIYYDGNYILPLSNPAGMTLRGVWVDSDSSAWAVGADGVILRYQNGGWSTLPFGGRSSDLEDVWGASASDVFAVGHGGSILHFDGEAWAPMESPTTARLHAVWGRSGRDVYAVGDGGTLLHYDGEAWRPLDSGTSVALRGIRGADSDRVLAVGDAAVIIEGRPGLADAPLDPARDLVVREEPFGVVGDVQTRQVLRQLPRAHVALRHQDRHDDHRPARQLVLQLDHLADAPHRLRPHRIGRVIAHQAELHVPEAGEPPDAVGHGAQVRHPTGMVLRRVGPVPDDVERLLGGARRQVQRALAQDRRDLH